MFGFFWDLGLLFFAEFIEIRFGPSWQRSLFPKQELADYRIGAEVLRCSRAPRVRGHARGHVRGHLDTIIWEMMSIKVLRSSCFVENYTPVLRGGHRVLKTSGLLRMTSVLVDSLEYMVIVMMCFVSCFVWFFGFRTSVFSEFIEIRFGLS